MAFKAVLGWGGDRKVMQLDFLQNKMKAVMNHYRKKKNISMEDCGLCMLKGQKNHRDALQS